MAGFDFVDAASKGYHFVWTNRSYIAKFAFPVLFITVFCNLMIFFYGLEDNLLRGSLVAMPASFAQGLFLAELVRYAIFNEPIIYWGYVSRKEFNKYKDMYMERQNDKVRRASIHASIALYILPYALTLLAIGLVEFYNGREAVPAQAPTPNLATFLVFALSLSAMVWLVRVFFLYVAVAMGYSIKNYMKKISGMYSSVCFIMGNLIVIFPMLMLVSGFNTMVYNLFSGYPVATILLVTIISSAGGIIILSIMTVAMAYGIREMLEGHGNNSSGKGIK